jgi:hypothetical protein
MHVGRQPPMALKKREGTGDIRLEHLVVCPSKSYSAWSQPRPEGFIVPTVAAERYLAGHTLEGHPLQVNVCTLSASRFVWVLSRVVRAVSGDSGENRLVVEACHGRLSHLVKSWAVTPAVCGTLPTLLPALALAVAWPHVSVRRRRGRRPRQPAWRRGERLSVPAFRARAACARCALGLWKARCRRLALHPPMNGLRRS